MKKPTLMLAAITLSLCSPGAMLAQSVGRIIEIKHVALDSFPDVADTQHIWVFPMGSTVERAEAFVDRPLRSLDQLGLLLPWASRLGIDYTRQVGPRTQTREAEAVVARAFNDSDGNKILRGPAAGSQGALYRFERTTNDRTRVEVVRGAIVLREWPEQVAEAVCIHAVGGCTTTLGTDYALEVDDGGRARLAVWSGEVQIDWTSEEDSTNVVLVTAAAKSVWTWTATDPPEEEDTDDDLLAAIWDGLKHNGKEIWEDGGSFFGKPYVWGPIAVGGGIGIACLLKLFGFCDGDAKGLVIVNP